MDVKTLCFFVAFLVYLLVTPGEGTFGKCITFPACKPFYEGFDRKKMEIRREGVGGKRNCESGDYMACWWTDMMTVRGRMDEPDPVCLKQVLEFHLNFLPPEPWISKSPLREMEEHHPKEV